MFQITPWSAPPLLVILLAIWAMDSLKEKNRVPGTLALNWLLAGVIIWSMSQLFRSLVTILELKLAATYLEQLGKLIVPVAWFAFTITFANNTLRLSPKTLTALAAIPALTFLVAITNEQHHLLWASIELVKFGDFVGVSLSPGPWVIVIASYSVVLVLCGTAIAANELMQLKRRLLPVTTIIVTPIIVCITTLVDDAGLSPLQGTDLTPIGLIIGSVLLRAGVLSAGLLSHKRIIRHAVVEQLSDMVVIIDPAANVLDCNTAAELGLNIQTRIGQTHSRLKLPILHELIRTNSLSTELTIGNQAYDVQSTPLNDKQANCFDEPKERVLVFRNVTARRKAERALQNAKQELETQAHTDPLTGLYNRRFFMQRLEEEAERLRRHNNALSCLIFDLDHFKKINDTYGHDIGDEVLKMVAAMTRNATRLTDVAARIGGEEFAMLLPETDAEGAIQLANRLRKSIQNGQVFTAQEQRVNVTASVGLVTVNKIEGNLDALLGKADKALYRAKGSGRNMVCVAD